MSDTMNLLEIPLNPSSPEQFQVSLSNILYQFTVTYKDCDTGWILDIADNQGNPLVCGIPLIMGSNFLGQYAYLGIPGALFLDGPSDDPPTFDNLGTDYRLYYAVAS